MPRRRLARVLPLLAIAIATATAALLSACAWAPPQPGSRVEALQAAWGSPTARYALPEGAQQLEYATGPYGRQTWMVQVDAGGRVLQARQVLTEAELMAAQAAAPLPADALLRRLGTPGERRGARGGGQTWSWRYDTNDCLYFQFSVDATGIARSGAFAIDPLCDVASDMSSSRD